MTPEEFKAVCEEFDNAPDSEVWFPGHPIFQLAKENDDLRKEVERWKQVAEDAACANTKTEAHEIVEKAMGSIGI